MVKRRKGTASEPPEETTSLEITGLSPGISSILGSESSLSAKRAKLLVELGLRKTKQKYATPADRKAAAKARAKARREQRNLVFQKYGLEPSAKTPKRTTEEKKAARKGKAASKRGFLREMAKKDPDLAKKYGIDVSKFKL